MNKKPILVFDTETTGLPKDYKDFTREDCPRLVQIAMALFTPEGKRMHCYASIVHQEGREIPIEASNVHGITTEIAKEYGIQLKPILDHFSILLAFYEPIIVGHNIDFDKLIVASEIYRFNGLSESFLNSFESFCTMKSSTDLCKLPGRYGKYKWPKLTEAVRLLLGKELSGAHDALVDVNACAELYFFLQKELPSESIAELYQPTKDRND